MEFYLYVCVWYLWETVVFDPLKLELQMVISCHVSARNWIWVS